MSGAGAKKGSDRAKRQRFAHEAAHLRGARFELEGFKSNARTPSLADATSMAMRNRSRMAGKPVEGGMRTPSH